jgi:hypothetical protein
MIKHSTTLLAMAAAPYGTMDVHNMIHIISYTMLHASIMAMLCGTHPLNAAF